MSTDICERSIEFRATPAVSGDGRTLEGHGSVFDQPTIIDDHEEVVLRGAFRRTLAEHLPVMQFDHGNDKRTGSVPIAAIDDIHEDREGLFVRARLFDNDLVEPIRQAIEGRAVRGMSIKFRIGEDRWVDRSGKPVASDEVPGLRRNPGDRGPLRREITEIYPLYELGPVVFPAFRQTDVGVRGRGRFDPDQVAVRGVLAQFGLDTGCVRRHLDLFDAQARAALADEIFQTFPELRELLGQEAAEGESPQSIRSAVIRDRLRIHMERK